MKILEANDAALFNFEVLDFLRTKGASKDRTRVIANVAQSEYKVYDYLVSTVACDQTRERISEFLKGVKKHDLTKAEILNTVNIRPTDPVEIFPIIESCEDRFPDEEIMEMVELVTNTLQPPVNTTKPEETNGTEETATLNKDKDDENRQDQNEGEDLMETS